MMIAESCQARAEVHDRVSGILVLSRIVGDPQTARKLGGRQVGVYAINHIPDRWALGR
jgi:hypothetical protein